MGRRTARIPANRLTFDLGHVQRRTRPEAVSVEEPLQIRVDRQPIAVTMRTPGDDFDLTLGFLITEAIIRTASEIRQLRHCQDLGEDGLPTYNVVDAFRQPGAEPLTHTPRAFVTASGCGVCGMSSIDQVRQRSPFDLRTDPTVFDPRIILQSPERLREHQSDFARTGGLHAAGLFSADGELLVAREDIGRHNAVDKVIGWAARNNRLPLVGTVLVVTSRASFELAQKALMAAIPVLAAVSAPSSLAIQLAADTGLTLVGFVRPPRLTIYRDDLDRLSTQPPQASPTHSH